jgi:hypothetical protein
MKKQRGMPQVMHETNVDAMLKHLFEQGDKEVKIVGDPYKPAGEVFHRKIADSAVGCGLRIGLGTARPLL